MRSLSLFGCKIKHTSPKLKGLFVRVHNWLIQDCVQACRKLYKLAWMVCLDSSNRQRTICQDTVYAVSGLLTTSTGLSYTTKSSSPPLHPNFLNSSPSCLRATFGG